MTLMTSPTERDDELPSDEFTPAAPPPGAPPTAQQATTAPSVEPQSAAAPPSVEPAPAAAPPPGGVQSGVTLDRVMGRIDDLERLVHKVRGVSARAFYATVAALVALAVGASAYVGGQFAVVHDRMDALVVELRESDARQNARIDTVLVELRESEARQVAQLRDAEARQIQRVDELARELRAELRASEERQNRRIDELAAELRAAMDVLADIQARLVRLETIAGLPPLPPIQSVSPTNSAPSDDS